MAALPAIGGQQEAAQSWPTARPSAGHSPPRGAVVRSGRAAAAGEPAWRKARRTQRTRVRAARAPIAAKPQRRPLVCAKRPNERSEREPRGECASRGRHGQITRARCWRTGARRIFGGGASDGPATAAGKRRSVPAPTSAGCWRGPERATRGTRAKPADCGHALAHWNGVLESALAHRKHTGARTWNF